MNPASTQSLPNPYHNLLSIKKNVRVPRLSEVLDGTSPQPWDLTAFEMFLEANYCGEILQFTTEVASYKWYYDVKSSCSTAKTEGGSPSTLSIVFEKLIQTFIEPDSEREINIPGDVRDYLLSLRSSPNPPNPAVFDAACNMMYDLMAGLFVEFLKWRPSDRLSLPGMSSTKDCSITKGCPENVKELTLPLSGFFPVYERKHKIWNPARVYRNIKRRYPRAKHSKSISDSSSVTS